ncbi:RNA-directed DNA polymerase, eukaryota, partial [Tanacetum coccineum]
GSIIDVIENLVDVGQTMGYNMEGCKKNLEDIVASHGDSQKNRINFVAIQETKLDNIDLFSIKELWGNFSFEFAISPSVGFSGGILCVWDPNIFVKDNVTILDSFVVVRGTWMSSSTKLLIVSVCAPQDLSEKKSLWDYISHMIDTWNEECLIDIPLEGYSYTWATKSTSKMSKLDRFLVSEGLLSIYPSLSALCLAKNLSDHRPIILREAVVDYGPSLFRVYHSWFAKDGFEKLVDDSPTKSDGFEQIMDFLNAHPIRYALTINPTIYISCIEQFWSTLKAKTINEEEQLHALVDGKKIIITESSVRSDDKEGIDCLPNSTIFEQLTLMGYEKISQKLTFL